MNTPHPPHQPHHSHSHEAQTRRYVTDMLHSILREHMRLASAAPRSTAFRSTRSQRAADLMQALTQTQRNM